MGALCGSSSPTTDDKQSDAITTNNKETTTTASGSGDAGNANTTTSTTAPAAADSDEKKSDDDQPTDELKIERMAELSKRIDSKTIEAAKTIAAIYGSSPKSWGKKADGSDYTDDDFNTMTSSDESLQEQLKLFNQLSPEDQAKLLISVYHERYLELTDQFGPGKLNSFALSAAANVADNEAPPLIKDTTVSEGIRPFLMKISEYKDPMLAEQKDNERKTQRDAIMAAAAEKASAGATMMLAEAGSGGGQEGSEIIKFVTGKLEDAINGKVTAKASGADRAFTNIVDPLSKGINIPLKDYNNVAVTIDTSILTQKAQENVQNKELILIEAGSYVGKIEATYWPNYDKDKATLDGARCLPNRGGYNDLSVVGLSAVGAMGYGNGNPNISANGTNQAIQQVIRSLRAITVEKDGSGKKVLKHYQIEPKSNPVHDPDKWPYGKDVELKQDDNLFNDWVTQFGIYGVITHCYITLVPGFLLEEERHGYLASKWEEKFDELCADDTANLLQLWFSPYHNNTDKDIMVYSAWRNSSRTTPDKQKYIKEKGGAIRNVTNFELWAGEKAMLAAANSGSGSVAFFMQCSLQQTEDKAKTLTMTAPQALNFGKTNDVPTITSGVGFNMNGKEQIDSVKSIVNKYMHFLRQQADKHKWYITSPFALRFAKQSNGTMSIAFEYNCAWIEQPALKDTRNIEKLLQSAWEEFWWGENADNNKMHWGLWFPMNSDKLKDNVFKNIGKDNLDQFVTNYRKFNSGQVFRNTFTNVSGLDEMAGFDKSE